MLWHGGRAPGRTSEAGEELNTFYKRTIDQRRKIRDIHCRDKIGCLISEENWREIVLISWHSSTMAHNKPITPSQIEFLAEDEEITIVPNFKLARVDFINVSVRLFDTTARFSPAYRVPTDHSNLLSLRLYLFGLPSCWSSRRNAEFNPRRGCTLINWISNWKKNVKFSPHNLEICRFTIWLWAKFFFNSMQASTTHFLSVC